MGRKKEARDLRADFPWVFAPQGQWIQGIDAARAGLTRSIATMDAPHLANSIAMIKRELGELGDDIRDEDLNEYRRHAHAKIAEMEKALKKLR